MLKAAGLVGLVVSLGLYGVFKSRELKQRINLQRDFWQMMLQIKSEIHYLQEPLQSVLQQKKGDTESRAFRLLFAVQQKLSEEQTNLQSAWEESVKTIYAGTPLTAQDVEVFCYPGTFLGQTDCENQLQQFDYLQDRLRLQIQKAEETYRTKGPLLRRIGFFAGGLIAVVLL